MGLSVLVGLPFWSLKTTELLNLFEKMHLQKWGAWSCEQITGSGGALTQYSTSPLWWTHRAVVVKPAPAAATPSPSRMHRLVCHLQSKTWRMRTWARLLRGCLQAGTPVPVQIWALTCETWIFWCLLNCQESRQEMCVNVSLTLHLVASHA